MVSAATKEAAHEMIEKLSPDKALVAVETLQRLLDPVAYSLAHAPLEDEEISKAEEESVARSKAEMRPPSEESHRALLAEFGLTAEDWERMGDEPLKSNGSGHQTWQSGSTGSDAAKHYSIVSKPVNASHSTL